MLSDRFLVPYDEAHVKILAEVETKLTTLPNIATRTVQMGTL